MTFCVDNEMNAEFPFDIEETIKSVCEAVLKEEKCPYEVQINVVLTDNEGIRELNREFRNIDRETDVLSFPGLEFETPGEFIVGEEQKADCFDPDTKELILGDIMISVDKVYSQAEEYGHSTKREFAFLIAHSMLHLCGYDHMEEQDAKLMEQKQKMILDELGIQRD